MAQGFLNDSLAASGEDLDIVGDEYFNNLVMHSFFQEVDKDSKGRIEFCEMHDLIHDFAKSLVENECFTLTIKDTNAQEFNFSRARHLYLLIEEISVIPSFVYKAKNLRTLKIYGHIPNVSSELFCELTCLRTLDLGNTYLEELSNEIEKLIHLRYLNLSQARFKELPETLTRLYNLQVLQLYACRNLYKLPEGIGGLVNLIDLGLLECHQLSHLPEGIGKLTRLRGLSDFIIGGVERGGWKIGELKNLNFLKGSLRIISLERVKNGNEAKMACLKDKQKKEKEEDEDGGCARKRCKQLPSTLGKLPFLETLVIAEMYKVKFMGVEFFAIDDAIRSDNGVDTIFPKLKVFQIDGMWNLKEWDMRVQEKYGKEFSFMPCLEYLSLIVLPKLRSFPQHLTQSLSLKKLFIWYCPKLNWMPSPSSHLPFLHFEELILKWDAGSFSKSLVANNHMFFPKLRLLSVRKSPYSSLPEGLGNLTSLETLDIRTCSKIKSIPEKELRHLTTLKELTIVRCPALRRRCKKDIGEDWSKIFHIPKIFIDGDMIKQGTASTTTGHGGKKSEQDATHHILKSKHNMLNF
ncbi:putative disease resistance protein RGA3 [Macadamia integrifolia]|uniref:putative disease resistance protein RGA3 n=1 Tax=Macadamia integrifolia TaxID=60698 RepID=UPI001C4F830F|nr:putative disease resistance protein RGA3 [Macadamia integrifolia]